MDYKSALIGLCILILIAYLIYKKSKIFGSFAIFVISFVVLSVFVGTEYEIIGIVTPFLGFSLLIVEFATIRRKQK